MHNTHPQRIEPTTGHDARNTFTTFIERATADPEVVGLVLKGSQTHEHTPTDRSDYDLYVVTVDEADTELNRLRGFRSPHLDLVVLPLAEFRTIGMPGSPLSWERYAFVHAQVLLDRCDGQIAQLVERKARLTAAEAHQITGDYLDAYINSLYRSLKNHRDGFPDAAHLDAAESIPYLLTTLFALDQRVRPYNKYLRWELQRNPLSNPLWTVDRLLPKLRQITAAGKPQVQRSFFAEVEAAARIKDHGPTIDAWGADLLFLHSAQTGHGWRFALSRLMVELWHPVGLLPDPYIPKR